MYSYRTKSMSPNKFTILKDAIKDWCAGTGQDIATLAEHAGICERQIAAFIHPKGQRLNAKTLTSLTVVLRPHYRQRLRHLNQYIIPTRAVSSELGRIQGYLRAFGDEGGLS